MDRLIIIAEGPFMLVLRSGWNSINWDIALQRGLSSTLSSCDSSCDRDTYSRSLYFVGATDSSDQEPRESKLLWHNINRT